MAKENSIKNLMVERETYQKDGKDFYSYFVKGKFVGKKFRHVYLQKILAATTF